MPPRRDRDRAARPRGLTQRMQYRPNGRWSRGGENAMTPYAPSHHGPPARRELVASMPTPTLHPARARVGLGVPRTLADTFAGDPEGHLVALSRTGSVDTLTAVRTGERVRPVGWPRACRVGRRNNSIRATPLRLELLLRSARPPRSIRVTRTTRDAFLRIRAALLEKSELASIHGGDLPAACCIVSASEIMKFRVWVPVKAARRLPIRTV
jgi:hypothetical protein